MVNSRRVRAAALGGTVVLSGCMVTWFAAFGSAGIEKIGASVTGASVTGASVTSVSVTFASVTAASVDDSGAAAVVADAVSATSSATATSNAGVDTPNAVTTSEPDAIVTTNPAPTAQQTEPVVAAALSDPALPAETRPVQMPAANTPDTAPRVAKGTAGAAVDSVEILDECWDVNACVDRYLWALYQRTPKEDSIKVPEQRQVRVKRKKKMVTVTRTFTRLVDEDFAWKDTKAAERIGMPMADYVIGGVDRSFRLKLFHALLAAEQAGLSPGITSAFRDDYRQSIASGLKAASSRSYHGGSFRGGYGHGLAADIVSTDGATRDERWASSEKLWKWMDAHGKEFGVGRPYLAYDPPHLAPIDGQEYAHHRGGAKTQQAALDTKARGRHAARDKHAAAKRAKTAKSSKVRTI
ncbi:peptidase M15 [Bradyrhizobium jicamae]|uniref:Peptidase M15 n=1 Tax=Bradyrhizobium jicamae TaxID=280332 RepID=A0ABS5FKK6_9BRAD|nr:peptidase M15 [Bradyrhizobium jicamae]MBR0796906.1 peptidase M15 [Bradyrhizobium jicamae]